MKLNPKDAKSAFNLGVALEGISRNDDALAAYRTASVRDTAYADPYLNAGALLARLGRRDEARTAFERYLVLAPDSPRATEIKKALATLEKPTHRKR